jgi:ankyrin repeat protein
MGRIILIAGALLALVGAVGLYEFGQATIRVFELLAWTTESPIPRPTVAMGPLAVAGPALFLIGMVLLLVGLRSVAVRQGWNTPGRILFVLAGLGTTIASLAIAWSLHQQGNCLSEIGSSETRPDFTRLEEVMARAESVSRPGWGLLIVAQGVILLASLATFKKATSPDPGRVCLSRRWLLATSGILAGVIAVVYYLGWANYMTGLRIVNAASEYPGLRETNSEHPLPENSLETDSEERALAETKRALSQGGSPQDIVELENGLTRMHAAARAGHVKVLRYLIEQGANVDMPNPGNGETPLHWAATGEVVDLLIAKGADKQARGAAGELPLAAMALRNRPSAVSRMIAHGADVNARDTLFGSSVIMSACIGLVVVYEDDPALNRYGDRMTIIEELVAHGAGVNAQDHDGETALHVASKYHASFVALLLRLGADPAIKDKSGKLPIDWSRELGLDDAAKLLENASKR